ncbi:MAG: 8-oxo-dGTP diphosphatase MutT [Alphaproteobacteria bacterium]|nr:8-oxo-dGTP diphosphatase MutT [Alphaproteobacteria bacterium]
MSCLEALSQPRNETAAGLPLILVAAVVLVNPQGEVLLATRPEGKSMAGLWEFPGGKVKEGETPEFALCRELEEELGIETRECCFAPLGFASHSYDDFHLMMPLYVCRMWKGEPTPQEGQELTWVQPSKLASYDMPEADIPLIYQIQDRL